MFVFLQLIISLIAKNRFFAIINRRTYGPDDKGRTCQQSVNGIISGGLEGIRTLGRSIKSRTLYLAELQARMDLLITFS